MEGSVGLRKKTSPIESHYGGIIRLWVYLGNFHVISLIYIKAHEAPGFSSFSSLINADTQLSNWLLKLQFFKNRFSNSLYQTRLLLLDLSHSTSLL